jgi:hypothetical protein
MAEQHSVFPIPVFSKSDNWKTATNRKHGQPRCAHLSRSAADSFFESRVRAWSEAEQSCIKDAGASRPGGRRRGEEAPSSLVRVPPRLASEPFLDAQQKTAPSSWLVPPSRWPKTHTSRKSRRAASHQPRGPRGKETVRASVQKCLVVNGEWRSAHGESAFRHSSLVIRHGAWRRTAGPPPRHPLRAKCNFARRGVAIEAR